jgi:LuxR family transcriptional regulator, regulator of acetate metabolism
VEPPDDDGVTRTLEAVRAAADHLGATGSAATRDVVDPVSALDAAEQAERALKAELPTPTVWHLLLEVQAAKSDLLTFQIARQRSRLPILNRALATLRATSTIDDLVEAVPVQVVELGYDRAMFSWVENERWVPRSAHTVSRPEEGPAMLAAATEPYLHVRDLLEVDVVRKRRAILVTDAVGNPRVHPEISQVSHSHTYVAAPVVARGHVAAFVHLDRNLDTGTTDEFDRDLLAAFCEGLGLMLDRLAAEGGAQAVPPALTRSLTGVLTPRECEVLRLMAAGLTNSQIGQRLFVSEETAKSHVTNLMRKLGVRNRAQAGAVYHRLRAPAAGRAG